MLVNNRNTPKLHHSIIPADLQSQIQQGNSISTVSLEEIYRHAYLYFHNN